MFTWIADHSGTVYLLLALVAAGWAAGWWLNRERKYFIGLACVAGAALLVWLISLLVVTDRQLLTQDVRVLTEAVVAGNKQDMLQRMAPDLEYRGRKRDDLVDRAIKAVKVHQINEIRVWDIQVEEASRADSKAVVWFGATVFGPGGQLFVARCKGAFVWRNDRWQMHRIEAFNPVVNQDRPIEIPIP